MPAHVRAPLLLALLVSVFGAQRKGQDNAFDVIDLDDDGKISFNELSETTLPQCLRDMLAHALKDDKVDKDDDDLLSELEWYTLLSSRLGRLITVSEVAEWITYGVEKPQYADAFRQQSVSGHDFIEFVANGGQLLADELGITSKAARNHIRRQMIMKLCTDAQGPEIPSNLSIHTTASVGVVSWSEPVSVGAIIAYQLQRADGDEMEFVDLPVTDKSESFHDTGLKSGRVYVYRVQAWSVFGRSGWSDMVEYKHKTNTAHAMFATLNTSLSPQSWTDWVLIGFASLCCFMAYNAMSSRPSSSPKQTSMTSPVRSLSAIGQKIGLKRLSPIPSTSSLSDDSDRDEVKSNPTSGPSVLVRSYNSSPSLRTPKTDKLRAPSHVGVTGGDQQITICWVYDADRSHLSHFSIECRHEQNETRRYRADASANFYDIKGLENGKSYTVRVLAQSQSRKCAGARAKTVMPLPDQNKNSANLCNWCRRRLGFKRHVCSQCDASFCPTHGHSPHCFSPLTPCLLCVCQFCITTEQRQRVES